MKRLLPLPLVALVVAGCGQRAVEPPGPAHAPSAAKPIQRYEHKVQVTVLDGNTGRPVRGARVTIGRRSVVANGRGVAVIPAPELALITAVRAQGYAPSSTRLWFRTYPKSAVLLYRPGLQWPMYGVNVGRTQAQSQIHLRPPFRTIWSRGLGGLIEFPAVVSDGVAYIGNARGTVFALEMSSGRVIWRHPTPSGKMAASTAVWRDKLVTHGMDGHVRVLRRSDGRLLASVSVGAPVESSPVLRGGVDYFGSWNGGVEALDLRSRRVLWTYRSGCKITSSAAISGSTLYIGDYCGRLLALSRSTGRLRWAGRVNGRIYGTPAVGGARVFVGSSTGGSMSAFSNHGRLLWRRSFGSYVYSSPAVWRGRIFFGTYAGVFYGLSAATGATAWSVGVGGPISGAAVVVDGIAYAGSFAHRIVGVDTRSGRVLVDFPHGEYVPVSGDGRRLLLHGYSRLYAVTER